MRVALAAVLSLLSIDAAASPKRAGIFVGTNAGSGEREPLRHAESDAARMREVFVELGEVAPENAILLKGPSADQIVAAIERVDADMLIFYYSGHADDRALLLGETVLSLRDLTAALAKVPARLSLHLIDACRSGALTRRKGAKLGERFSLEAVPSGEGRVVITSSAEWEDSQESDRLGGSFFTLHLASGLRGAADLDGDARVTLREAYRYVYGRTVESTIATVAGAQHPTYAYDLSGRGDVVLTWTTRAGGTLLLAAGDYLVIDEQRGHIVAEVEPTESTRLTLAPGEYRVRKRTRSELWTGRVRIEAGRTYVADDLLEERVAHARLVRKGGIRDPETAHAVRIAGGVRGKVADGVNAVPIFRAGYELVLPWLSLSPYVSITTAAGFETARLAYETSEIGAGLSVSRAFDFPYLTLRGALLLEGVRLHQSEVGSKEKSRTTWGGAFALAGAIETPPLLDFSAALSVEGALYAYRATDDRVAPTGDGELVTRPTYRVLLTLGYGF